MWKSLRTSQSFFFIFLVISPLPLYGIGCTGSNYSQPNKQNKQMIRFDIGVHNNNDFKIHDVAVGWNSFYFSFGVLGPGADATYALVPSNLPQQATVSWISLEGRQHSQQVDIARHVIGSFDGTVFFEIHEDASVSVRLEHLPPE